MGKTYKHQTRGRFDDEFSSGRSGKHSNHANGKKTKGLRTLNTYVEEEDNPFQDDLEVKDEIIIQHIQRQY